MTSSPPLGFWKTFAFGALTAGVAIVAAGIPTFAYIVYVAMVERARVSEIVESAEVDGFANAISFVFMLPAVVLAMWIIARFSRVPMKTLVGLHRVRAWQLLVAPAVGLGAALALDAIYGALGADFGDRVMTAQYCRARSLPFYAGATIVLAPIAEEIFYRGFLIHGFSSSKLRLGGALALTTVLWTATHVQYEPTVLAGVLVFGSLLGISRVATGSIYPALAMHVAWNAIALASLHHELQSAEVSCDPRTAVAIVFAEPKALPESWLQLGAKYEPAGAWARPRAIHSIRRALAAYPVYRIRRTLTNIYVPERIAFGEAEIEWGDDHDVMFLPRAKVELGLHAQLSGRLLRENRRLFPEEAWRACNPSGFVYQDEQTDREAPLELEAGSDPAFFGEGGKASLEGDVALLAQVAFVGTMQDWYRVEHSKALAEKMRLLRAFYDRLGVEVPPR